MPDQPNRIHLGVISFGLAMGVTGAIFAFLLAVAVGLLGWSPVPVEILSHLFIGYGPTIIGAIAGAVWAFVDGFIAGILIAWLYNTFLRTRR